MVLYTVVASYLIIEGDVASVNVIPDEEVGVDGQPSSGDAREQSHGAIALHRRELVYELRRKRDAFHGTHLAYRGVR